MIDLPMIDLTTWPEERLLEDLALYKRMAAEAGDRRDSVTCDMAEEAIEAFEGELRRRGYKPMLSGHEAVEHGTVVVPEKAWRALCHLFVVINDRYGNPDIDLLGRKPGDPLPSLMDVDEALKACHMAKAWVKL